MQSDPRKLLYDIAMASEAIGGFCAGRSLADYRADLLLRSACERQFEIIGEAMTRLRDLHPDVFSRLPDGRDVIGFRNRLIHGYDTVDSDIVWDVIRQRLPGLGIGAQRHLRELA
jgi:uncharacterized protein with HEPN domain